MRRKPRLDGRKQASFALESNVAPMQKALKTQKMGKAKAFWAGADFDFSQKALKTQIICWRRVCFLADSAENAETLGKLKLVFLAESAENTDFTIDF